MSVKERQVAALKAFCEQRMKNNLIGIEKYWADDGTLTPSQNAKKTYTGHGEIKEYYRNAPAARGSYSEPEYVHQDLYEFVLDAGMGVKYSVHVRFSEDDVYFKSFQAQSIGWVNQMYFDLTTYIGKD